MLITKIITADHKILIAKGFSTPEQVDFPIDLARLRCVNQSIFSEP